MNDEYDALVSDVAETLDVRAGLSHALDIAEYAALQNDVAGALDTRSGLRTALDSLPPAKDRPQIIFGFLGATAIRFEDHLDDRWGMPRMRAMLAALLLHAGRPVSADSLAQWMWSDGSPRPRNLGQTLHTYAARLRRSLRNVNAHVRVVITSGDYQLDVDCSTIDYHRFRSLSVEAKIFLAQGQPHRAWDIARQAIQLWRGRPLDDLVNTRADNWRHRFIAEEWLPTNITLLEALIALGEFRTAKERLDELLADYPDDLALAKLTMVTLQGLGRSTEATAFYFTTRRYLLSEGNDRAADHLRQFHDNLRTTATNTRSRAVGDVVPRQLPRTPAKFVGREALLRMIDDAATRSGVITIEGMPGVGKTALAVQWAHAARHRFPEGDFFVDLNGFSSRPAASTSLVVDDMLSALGHPSGSGLSPRAKEALLQHHLTDRRTLVILDNARDAAHVKDLIPLLSSSLVVVTSRQRLAPLMVVGARRVAVEPMATAEAAALFSTLMGPRRHIDEHDRHRLANVSAGLPLAISLLAEQTTARFGQLSDLSQIFSWSYLALAAPEQRLFRLLGLHPGSDISLPVACAYDDRTRAETERSLALLVGAHLLERSEWSRYRLHDLLHEFAVLQAEQDETPESRDVAVRRAVHHYVATAGQAQRWLHAGPTGVSGLPLDNAVERVVFADAAQARSWVDREQANLVESIRFSAVRGHHDLAWQLADVVAVLFDRHGYHENSRAVHELAVTSARMLGDTEAEASSLIGLAVTHTNLGDYAQAQHCLDLGLAFARDHGSERGQAAILHQLGRLDVLRGAPGNAVVRYRQALDLLERADDDHGLYWTHCRLGEAHRLLRQHDQALVNLYKALNLADKFGDESARAVSLVEIGLVHRERGDLAIAVAHCERALIAVNTLPVPNLAVTTQLYTALAETNLERGDLNAATKYVLRVVSLAQQTYDITAEARAQDLLGDIQLADGEPDHAVSSWWLAVTLHDRTGDNARSAITLAKIEAAAQTRTHQPQS